MKKIYALLIFLLSVLSFNSNAQVTGDTCTNPVIINLCGATYSNQTNQFTYHDYNNTKTFQVGSKKIVTQGEYNYYQINLPTSSYQPVSLSASLAGYYESQGYTGEIYFFWYNSSPCNSNPVAVDSFYTSGIQSLNDSLFASYIVSQVQTQYYLVINFNSNLNYQYSLQFGFNNNEPFPAPVCSAAPKPYKGTMGLDKSECYTSASPYDLPLTDLLYNPADSVMLFPLTLNQKLTYLPINDDNGNGFILSLKRSGNVDAYTSFDQFPYTYSGDADYQVGLTVFFKNTGGATGLKGFRIRVPYSYAFSTVYPSGSDFYNTAGTWVSNSDPSTGTVTWLFNSSTGRGDNINNNGYSCQVYTFSATFWNLGDTIEAWYLPDNYGNDSIECVTGASNPPRTDCGLTPGNYETDGWIQIGANGAGGSSITGNACGSMSGCNPGVEFSFGGNYYNYYGNSGCDIFYPYLNSDCPYGIYDNNDPVITYDSSGCVTEIDPYWNEEFPGMNFTRDDFEQSPELNIATCNGSPYQLLLTNNGNTYGGTPAVLVYNTNGNFENNFQGAAYPVDSLGNINYNINLDNYTGSFSALPQYPAGNFTVPLTVPGYYSLCFSAIVSPYSNGTIDTLVTYCGNVGIYYLAADTPGFTFSPPSPDTSLCRGSTLTIGLNSNNVNTYSWIPDSATINYNYYNYYEVSPFENTTYTVTSIDQYGCTDTQNYVIKVHACPPTAAFTYTNYCPQLCETINDESGGAPTYWKWNFPGATPSSYIGQNPPQVCYPSKGLYLVSLFVSNALGEDSVTQYIQAGSCGELVSMTVKDTVVCAGSCVNFYNHVYYSSNQYFWYFPGGTPSIDSTMNYNNLPDSIRACYADTGTYIATVIALNPFGNDTFSLRIHVTDCGLTAGFIAADTVCNSSCITYTNISAGNPTSWAWSFGGGTPSSYNGQTPPQICYNTNGTYQTSLIVSNGTTSDTVYKNITIKNCSNPTASFSAPDSVCATNCITVTNTSSNATSWQWSFAGGTPSSYNGQTPPQVCYGTPGNYNIQLIAGNNNGADTLTIPLVVSNCLPNGFFSVIDTICRTDCVTLNNLSFSNVTSWQWIFPGGSPSSYNGATPPAICFDTTGTYIIELIASNSYGADTITAQTTVIECKPNGYFTVHDTICQTECIHLINPISINGATWQWNFPGGSPGAYSGANPPPVCYYTAGTFNVSLIISNTYGNDTITATDAVDVVANPNVTLSQNGDTLFCSAALSYQWFYINNIITGATNNFYIVSQNGSYSVLVANDVHCNETVSILVTDLATTNISDDDEIIISPNPNGGVFQVSGSLPNGQAGMLQVVGIEIYNVLGERVFVSSIKTEDIRPITIDLSNQADGVYFVKVQTENGMVMKKVVKN